MLKVLTVICACLAFHVPGHGPGTGVLKLFGVIRTGDTAELERMLNSGVNPNDTLDGYSPLMAAALDGTTEEMSILIRHGANVNYINHDSLTALWLAVPDKQKTLLLLDNNADLHIDARGGMTLLNKLAAIPGSASLIQLFIAKGADLEKNNVGNSLIIRSVISDDTSNLGLFIRLGLDINREDLSGIPPIVHAAQFHTLSTLAMLVEHGAKINAVSKRRGMTALMNAARNGDEESVVYLLEHGADAKIVSKNGYTALTFWGYSETDRPDITQKMYDQLGKAAFNKADDGANALYWSEKRGETRAVQLLKKYMQQ